MIEVKNKEDKFYQFVVKSSSGKVLLESVQFPDSKSIENAIEDIKDVDLPTRRFERKTNFEGKFLFTLKSNEGSVVGNSGLYNSEAGMENGIKNLKNMLIEN